MTIHYVYGKMPPPFVRSTGVHPFNDKHDRVDMIRNLFQPFVVCVSVVARWGQQLNDAAERSGTLEDLASCLLHIIRLHTSSGVPAIGIIAIEDLLNQIQIIFGIGYKDWAVQEIVSNRLADFTFATTAHSTGFVTKNTFEQCSDESPRWCRGVLLQPYFVAGG